MFRIIDGDLSATCFPRDSCKEISQESSISEKPATWTDTADGMCKTLNASVETWCGLGINSGPVKYDARGQQQRSSPKRREAPVLPSTVASEVQN